MSDPRETTGSVRARPVAGRAGRAPSAGVACNPYYKGDIVYKGARHLGIHDRLVQPTVWTKVQNVLDAHNIAGDRTQTHEHYLKGSLYRGCGKRMTINHARNRHGETYPYFICLGRHMGTTGCERQAMRISTVDNPVAEHYRTIELSPEATDALTGMIEDIFTQLDAESETQRRDLTRQKERLEDEQFRLLQAHYADAISLPVLKKEQHRIEGMLTTSTNACLPTGLGARMPSSGYAPTCAWRPTPTRSTSPATTPAQPSVLHHDHAPSEP